MFAADGKDTSVLSGDTGAPSPLSPEELAELEAGLAEAERGETVSGERHKQPP